MIRLETLRVGMRELSGNKLRTGLTALGIVFGVAAVIAMVSIAEGARDEALRDVEALGTNAVRVRALTLQGSDLADARQKGVSGLSVDDVRALLRLPGVQAAAPLAVVDVPVRHGAKAPQLRVVGTWPSLPDVTQATLAEGRFLGDEDELERAPVAVLGAEAAQELVPFQSALGEKITLGSETFTVVGVMTDRREATSHASLLDASDPGRDVYVPAATALVRFPRDPAKAEVSEAALRIASAGSVRTSAGLVRDDLARRHRGVTDYQVVVPEELLRQSQRSQRIFNVVMGAIASISLVVGGIGIMNVMLVTVIQRTREIGIRRAVGATRRDIRDQFLVEALSIAVGGGAVGAILGGMLAFGISQYAGWVTIVSWKAVAAAFLVSGGVGVAFGLFPAVKASGVDPVECLRHE